MSEAEYFKVIALRMSSCCLSEKELLFRILNYEKDFLFYLYLFVNW